MALLILTSPCVLVGVHGQDGPYTALSTLYASTNGSTRWDSIRNWMDGTEGEDYCDWVFVECDDDDEKVERFWPKGNDMVGPIPTEFGLLTDLTELGMGYDILQGAKNKLSSTLPTELGMLPKLVKLDLGEGNSLTGTLPTQLGNLESLESGGSVYGAFARPPTLSSAHYLARTPTHWHARPPTGTPAYSPAHPPPPHRHLASWPHYLRLLSEQQA